MLMTGICTFPLHAGGIGRHVDPNGFPAELEGYQVGCARSAERIEDHAAFRTCCKDGNLAEVFRIGSEVQPPVLRVLRHDVPYVAGFCSVRMESQEIEPSLGKLASAPDTCSESECVARCCPRIIMRKSDRLPSRTSCSMSSSALKAAAFSAIGQDGRKLDLPTVTDTTNPRCRHDGPLDDLRLTRL